MCGNSFRSQRRDHHLAEHLGGPAGEGFSLLLVCAVEFGSFFPLEDVSEAMGSSLKGD